MKKLSLLTLLVSFSLFVQGQTAEEIVSKHVEAIGGAENWRKVNSMKMEGSVQIMGNEVNVTVTVLNQKGSKTEISIMGMTGYQLITPTEGWSFMPFQGQSAPEAMTADEVAESQSELDVQGSLVDYDVKGHKIELLGKEDVDGTECYKIKLTPKQGGDEIYFIDPSNFYIIKSIKHRKANGRDMEVTINYSSYKKLPEGIVVPMSMSQQFGELVIKNVSVNFPIDESFFKVK
ncbi:MAG: hypothetical protein N2747_11470 [Chitinophagaceae bacterium]|nr:hypothetical protein [Chitinophagaceae bacterium]